LSCALGDSAHALPILGDEGTNEAIGDGMELGEHIATRGVDGCRDFLEWRYGTWQRNIGKSEGRLRDMHALPRSAL
jgi:2-polyprenyl-6-methoxyphenol hydroxylase-like FAD-dependent oxidoreductase